MANQFQLFLSTVSALKVSSARNDAGWPWLPGSVAVDALCGCPGLSLYCQCRPCASFAADSGGTARC